MDNRNTQPLLIPPQGAPNLHFDVQEHGRCLLEVLFSRFQAHDHVMSFAEYMQFCLYEPGLGYYVSGLQKFGPDGDFITAPELSPLFGECLADSIVKVLRQNPGWSLLELGPGRGKLASSVLKRLKQLEISLPSYQILEVSPSLRQIQKENLCNYADDTSIIWLDRPPQSFKGIVIANEVIDALSVEKFRISNGSVKQLAVRHHEGQLTWEERPAHTHLEEQVNSIGQLAEAYESEICLQLGFWLKEICSGIKEGMLLFSDYGFSESEYYAAERMQGTLRCHYRHYAHNNPLILPGLQDITAWVNFTQLAEAAHDLGLEVSAYTSQSHFILGSGRLQKINYAMLATEEQMELNRQIKLLTMPQGMGEQFRFMQLNKNTDARLEAMCLRDLRYQL